MSKQDGRKYLSPSFTLRFNDEDWDMIPVKYQPKGDFKSKNTAKKWAERLKKEGKIWHYKIHHHVSQNTYHIYVPG